MTRGSMQYWQKRRAYRRLPRMRAIPRGAKETSLSSIVGYKVGMTSAMVIGEAQKASETSRACTIIEVPTMEAYGMRLYGKDGSTGYLKITNELYDKAAAQRAGVKKVAPERERIDAEKQGAKNCAGVSLLMVAYPNGTAVGQRHRDRFEAAIIGKSAAEKLEYAAKLLGKEIKPSDIFKNGEHVDIISISKGKGWQGPMKRFGTARQAHKATQKIRHVSPLGAFGTKRVLPNVPQAGQTGFNYRTEHNKLVLRIGKKGDAESVNPKQGFINYGNVVSDFIIIDGSIPGPAKRLVRIRKSIDNRDSKGIKEPRIGYIATTGKAII